MKKKKIKYLIFDLDRVLFNTDYLISLDKGFKGIEEPFSQRIIQRINWSKVKPFDLVYPEVFKCLKKWQKKRFNLLLFSEGDIEGQLFKLKFTGLDKFFLQINRFILNKDKEKYLPEVFKNIPHKAEVWLFEDKPTKLVWAKKIRQNTILVLVCHGPWWKKKINDFKPNYIVKKLTELEKYL